MRSSVRLSLNVVTYGCTVVFPIPFWRSNVTNMRCLFTGALKVAKIRSGFEAGVDSKQQKTAVSHLETGFQDLGSGSRLFYKPNYFAETSMNTMLAKLQVLSRMPKV